MELLQLLNPALQRSRPLGLEGVPYFFWVNDSDFNDFTQFEYGKTYEIYNKSGSDKSLSVTGKTAALDITHGIISGDNFISPNVKSATNITTVLSSLTFNTDYSDVKRFNATSQTWESYASSQFTQFEPGKGYNIVGLRTASFAYGKTETTTDFIYDSTGVRVKKTAAGTSTVYLGKDYDVTGALSAKYIFLGDRRVSTKKSDGTLEFVHGDHINSSNIVTDSSGNQTGMLEYDPYGSTVTHTGAADPKHKFTGQEEDNSTKLYNYNARLYDPQLGRFITGDRFIQSFKDPQSLNRYAYARNNPIIFTDPTGNFFWFIAMAIAAIVNAAIGAATAVISTVTAFMSGLLAGLGVTSVIGSSAAGFLANVMAGAAIGATLSTIDAAIQGRDIGKAAAFGAIGGALTAGIVGPGMGPVQTIANKIGLGSVLGIARVGIGSYQTYLSIKNKNYFSGAFSAINTYHTATIVAKQMQGTLNETSRPGEKENRSDELNKNKPSQSDDKGPGNMDPKPEPLQKPQDSQSSVEKEHDKAQKIRDIMNYFQKALTDMGNTPDDPNDGSNGGSPVLADSFIRSMMR